MPHLLSQPSPVMNLKREKRGGSRCSMVARYRFEDDQSPSYMANILYFWSLNAIRIPVSSYSKKPLVIVGTEYSMPANSSAIT